ncbi:GTP-binding protein LepA [Kribbella sp. CA-293567]|uniref:GTP-binding protein LepA n=1 Tax=Kribbella sp. CA-293567 TaxID=3002436 RepID=UPI0022DCF5A1|nr:GTP-binding protein LepA [Kribbella sp. CA-293567]WBQ03624.1 GTP-binding protein LepA [Kribbella sp. CA-293567]
MTQIPTRDGVSDQPPRATQEGLRRFVERFAEDHPPLSLAAADLTVNDAGEVRRRFGAVFGYLTRVEFEVERNVLELRALMPDATETDRFFYQEVWSPQELQHGVLLDAVQQNLGLTPVPADLSKVSAKIRLAGVLSQLPGMLGVIRLLYYLTGAATERSAVIAYSRLVDGLRAMDERALAETVIAPIRRQEPGHFAFYRLSAQALMVEEGLKAWQLQLARILRRRSFRLVGANSHRQQADFGDVARSIGLDRDLMDVARQVSLVERELLWAQRRGMEIPDYILAALREAIELSVAREAGLPVLSA